MRVCVGGSRPRGPGEKLAWNFVVVVVVVGGSASTVGVEGSPPGGGSRSGEVHGDVGRVGVADGGGGVGVGLEDVGGVGDDALGHFRDGFAERDRLGHLVVEASRGGLLDRAAACPQPQYRSRLVTRWFPVSDWDVSESSNVLVDVST